MLYSEKEMMKKKLSGAVVVLVGWSAVSGLPASSVYTGKWVHGRGDPERLALIDKAFDSMDVSAELACLSMMYKRDWDGLVLSNTAWPGWWIQNTYGGSYGMMPFLEEPYATWMKNAQGLWFRMMADGQEKDANGYVAPDGSLCDCTLVFRNGGRDLGFGHFGWAHSTGPVNDGQVKMQMTYYRQGDAGHDSNDWGIGFTAAGLVMECERLLVARDPGEIRERLPQLRRVAAFLDTRRDPERNLVRGGKGSNLLAPAFEGAVGPDGKKQMAYLTELSVNYCAGLDRLAEVCELAGVEQEAQAYRATAEKVRAALPALMDGQGSFIMFRDPYGTKHGVYGAATYGYFEATPNHDAVCMRVVDDVASRKIIKRMVSIKELAPYDLVLSNYPAYDEPGYPTGGLMGYGTWVHGGHWSTCQGRMNVACLRADEFEHPFRAWDRMCKLMQNFRADAPMGECGRSPWGGQLGSPFNAVLDCWGVPAGLVRGLFEYDYRDDGLRVRPHLPPGIVRYVQKKAVVFGKSKVYLSVTGSGKVVSATVNGAQCRVSSEGWIELSDLANSRVAAVEIACGTAKTEGAWKPVNGQALTLPDDSGFLEIPGELENRFHVDPRALRAFYEEMVRNGLGETYEGAMAETVLKLLLARHERRGMRQAGTLPLPDIAPVPTCDQGAVDAFYFTCALNMAGGLTDYLSGLTIWEGAKPNAVAVDIARRVDLFPRMRTQKDLFPMMIPKNGLPTLVGVTQGGGAPLQAELGRVSIFRKAIAADGIEALAATRDALKSVDPACLYTGTPAIGTALPLKRSWTCESELTLEVWVKPSGHGRILDKISIGGSNGFLIDLVGANQVRTIIGARHGGMDDAQSSAITLGRWAHIALVLNQASRDAVVYIDGKAAYEMKDLPVQTLY